MGAEGARGREFRYTGLYMFTRFCTTFLKNSVSRKTSSDNENLLRLMSF